jgi:hypothetical protein
LILAVGIAIAVVTFPYQDVGTAVQHPSPAAFLQVAADVAYSIVPFAPQARIAAALLPIAVVMARHPSRNPIAEAQTHEGRGGRRRG